MSTTVVGKIAKKEAFLAANKTDAVGTLIVQTDPSEFVRDANKAKRFMINAGAEICRALSVSSTAVSVTNLRSYPVLVDISLDASVLLTTTPADLIVKLAQMCRQSSSVLKTSGSGVLAAAVDLVPLLVTPTGSPAPDATRLQELTSENQDMTRTIAMLKANLAGYQDAKNEMNKSMDSAVSEQRNRANSINTAKQELEVSLSQMVAELKLKEAELKLESERVAQLEKSLESTSKILEAKSGMSDQHSAQLLKDLTESRKRENDYLSKVMQKEREASDLTSQINLLKSEQAQVLTKIANMEADVDKERNAASKARDENITLQSRDRSAKLEISELETRAKQAERESEELRAKVHSMLEVKTSALHAHPPSGTAAEDGSHALHQRLNAAVTELGQANLQLSSAQRELGSLNIEKRELESKRNSLEERLNQADSEKSRIGSERNSLQSECDRLKARISDLERSVSEKNRDIEEASNKVRAAKNEVQEEEMAKKGVEREVAFLKAEVARADRTAEDARAEAERFRAKMTRTSVEAEELAAETSGLKTKLSQKAEEVLELERRIASAPRPTSDVGGGADRALLEKLERIEAELAMQKATAQQSAHQGSSGRGNEFDDSFKDMLWKKLDGEKNGKSQQQQQGGRNADSDNEDDGFWSDKVSDEKKLLDEAQRLLKVEKDKAKSQQKKLEKMKEQWRRDRARCDPNNNRKKWDLQETKRQIDKQAEVLNSVVARLRKTAGWLKKRENKVDNLEDVVVRMIALKKEGGGASSPGMADDASIVDHVRQLQRISEEMDVDGSSLGSSGDDYWGDINFEADDRDFYGGGGGEGGYTRRDTQQDEVDDLEEQYARRQQAWGRQDNSSGILRKSNVSSNVVSSSLGGPVKSFQAQLSEWTRERSEAQKEVAVHVSWLDDLRKELTSTVYGGNAGGDEENNDPGAGGISAGVRARIRKGARGGAGGSELKSGGEDRQLFFPREV
jgi:predicted  nucleic acid-binding Zn-ribbon protein